MLDEIVQVGNSRHTIEQMMETADENTTVGQVYGTYKKRLIEAARTTEYQRKLAAWGKFVKQYRKGLIPTGRLREAIGTSDFIALTGNILTWKVMDAYMAAPPVWRKWTKIGRVQDFRPIRATALDGLDAPLPPVAEFGEYQSRNPTDRNYSYSIKKYGAKTGMSWEAVVDDFLGFLDDVPKAFARAAVNSETYFATKLYFGANGPVNSYTDLLSNATKYYFDSSFKNKMTGNLTFDNLSLAITMLTSQLSESGQPIDVTPKYLEVPPALEMTARRILSPGNLYLERVGDTTAGQVPRTNTQTNILASYGIEVIPNRFLPLVGTGTNSTAPGGSTTYGNSSWILWGEGGGTPLEMGFLIGHEQPELWQRTPNAVRVGGGVVAPEEGSFDNDTTEIRLRHCFGGSLMNPRFAVASDGSSV